MTDLFLGERPHSLDAAPFYGLSSKSWKGQKSER